MTEEYIRLQGADGKGVYGKLRAEGNDKVIIHIHGMTHSMNHMLELYSADYFPSRGYDHYRIGLYPRELDARNLAESTLTTHIRDIQIALDYFSARYQSVYISAHSLGALCTLILNPPNIKAISLWDPAFDVTHFWNSGTYLTHLPERKQYHMDYGNVFVIGEGMVEEISRYGDQQCLKLAKQMQTPVQLIIPEMTIFAVNPASSPENYKSAFPTTCEIAPMKGANHTFSNENNPQDLMKLTQSWFRRF